MEKNKIIGPIFLLAATLFFPAAIYAETIVLKSGKMVEGKLIEKTDKYLKIDFYGVPLTYYLDEIESIDGKPIKVVSYDEIVSGTAKESQAFLENSPNSAEAYNQRGVAYRMQGNQNDAIICFTKAIEINPQYAEAYLNRGLSYASSELKKYDQALSDFNKSIELNPNDNFFAYLSRGFIYYDKGNYDQVISDLGYVIEMRSDSADAYYKRGLAYAQKGNYDDAISDLNKVITLNPQYVDAYYNLGVVYDYRGDLDQAISSYSKGLEIDPNNGPIYNNRAIVYFLKKEYDKSWEDVHKAESLGYSNSKLLEKLKEVSGRKK